MNNQSFLKHLRDNIDNKLSEKTNWGRNQIKEIVESSISDAYAKALDEDKPIIVEKLEVTFKDKREELSKVNDSMNQGYSGSEFRENYENTLIKEEYSKGNSPEVVEGKYNGEFPPWDD